MIRLKIRLPDPVAGRAAALVFLALFLALFPTLLLAAADWPRLTQDSGSRFPNRTEGSGEASHRRELSKLAAALGSTAWCMRDEEPASRVPSPSQNRNSTQTDDRSSRGYFFFAPEGAEHSGLGRFFVVEGGSVGHTSRIDWSLTRSGERAILTLRFGPVISQQPERAFLALNRKAPASQTSEIELTWLRDGRKTLLRPCSSLPPSLLKGLLSSSRR